MGQMICTGRSYVNLSGKLAVLSILDQTQETGSKQRKTRCIHNTQHVAQEFVKQLIRPGRPGLLPQVKYGKGV